MGSLAKRIGQLSAKSMESESSQILRTIQSNKIPNSLSQRLDTTLKDSHDMKVFGLGTLSSMSNVERYTRFTHSMYGVYSTMEHELDLTANAGVVNDDVNSDVVSSSSSSAAVKHFWSHHEKILRRSAKLKQDLIQSNGPEYNIHEMEYSPSTQKYMEAIQMAGIHDREYGSGLLLGHAYTRYLADLMGGQVLATPTKLALGLEKVEQYSFDISGNDNGLGRKGYVEQIYKDLNISGNLLLSNDGEIQSESESENEQDKNDKIEEIVSEARIAFQHNIHVYAEEPIYLDSIVGLKNIISGWILSKMN